MHMTEENLGILVTFYQFMPLRHKDSVGVNRFAHIPFFENTTLSFSYTWPETISTAELFSSEDPCF